MGRMMLVSVIIPNHNYAEYLAKAIDSVVRQTWNELELIVVDDGSQDDSVSLIRELKAQNEHRFKAFIVISMPCNRGKLAALNAANCAISGETVLVLDADDYLHPEFITRVANHLTESRIRDVRCAFAYTDCVLVDPLGVVIGHGTAGPFDERRLKSNSYIPECGLTLTDVFREASPFDERIRVGTKHHKWLKMVNAGWTGSHLAEEIFYYRMHNRNLSGIGNRILRDSSNEVTTALEDYWILSEGDSHAI